MIQDSMVKIKFPELNLVAAKLNQVQFANFIFTLKQTCMKHQGFANLIRRVEQRSKFESRIIQFIVKNLYLQ